MAMIHKLSHMVQSSYRQIVSAVLVIVLILTMIPITQKPSESVAYASSTISEGTVRGVVDDITELPQYGNPNSSISRGTAERPFFILEVVPYEEQAEIGYQIGGCEPIDVDALSEAEVQGLEQTMSEIVSKNPNGGKHYYFPDETPDYDESHIVSITEITSGFSEGGYYLKYVAEGGKWDYRKNSDGSYSAVRKDGGNYVLCSSQPDGTEITDPNDESMTLQEGDYLAVTREASSDDPAYCANVSWYINDEVFLTKSMGMSEEEASNFSVLIKTITPDELNKTPEWIDYADLINVASSGHVGNLPEFYKDYNRLEHTGISDKWYPSNGFLNEDITWEVALRMYNKVTADENYAGLILDDIVFNTDKWDTSADKKSITLDVYDLQGNKVDSTSGQNTDGYRNNMYKFAIMLLSMDKDMFRLLYLTPQDKSDPNSTIIRDGKNYRQSGDAQDYWSVRTFLFVPDYTYKWWSYWNGNEEAWNNYHMTQLITTKKSLVIDHVYTYNGSSAITQDYLKPMYNNEQAIHDLFEKYEEFAAYCKENGIAINDVTPAIAVRFILGTYQKDRIDLLELNVLDIEPCVALDEDNEPDWQVDEAYIRKLVPSFKGKIHVEHQTTAEFNGKIEDLNSTYQMIFMGTDCGAYNLTDYYDGINQGNVKVPDWNDPKLGHMIYVHTGDMMYASQVQYKQSDSEYRSRSVNFLSNKSQDGYNFDGLYSKSKESTEWGWDMTWEKQQQIVACKKAAAEVRFLGNDITQKKKAELENYLKSGYPIVATSYLYELHPDFIDNQEECQVRQLVTEAKNPENNYPFFKFADMAGIKKALSSKHSVVTFTKTPQLYNGKTKSSTSAEIANPNYLNPDGGNASLDFAFTVTEPGYAYRIYVDQDKDSKFSSDEVVYAANAVQGENSFRYRVASAMYGSVMWKIEVYETGDERKEQNRYQRSGCSAIKRRDWVEKKTINVLQIMPDNTNGKGYLNLQTSTLFQKYYNGLEDYDVTMTSITWSKFDSLFKDSDDDSYGYSYVIDKDGKGIEKNANKVENLKIGGNEFALDTFNMIIVGFSDTYAGQDISNKNGAVYWLQHYADSGKSILFTHDTTSLYNRPYDGKKEIFGFTLNSIMRDRLGMNTYGMISNQLSDKDQNSAKYYQEKIYGGNYTEINSYQVNGYKYSPIHGYTYSSIQRIGDPMSGKSRKEGYNTYTKDNNFRMIYNKITEFKDVTNTTTSATQVNQGQITTYPYFISDSDAERDIKVATTHAQWFTLNLEDEDVTVWYTLGMDSDKNGLAYAASPKDAANNYYIYSKGNIFYSGVGHSEVKGDVEAKLFVNTMVAAYQASMEPPVVEVLNGEAVSVLPLNYTIEVPQEINVAEKVDGTVEEVAEELSGTYEVEFAPFEMNLISTEMTMTIKIGNGYVDEIYQGGKKLTANSSHEFVDVKNGQSYTLKYNLSNFNEEDESYRNIKFEISNNKVEGSNTTNLNMSIQPLFALD